MPNEQEIKQKDLPNYIGKEVIFEKDGSRRIALIQSADNDAVYGVILSKKDTWFMLILNNPYNIKYFVNE